MFSLFDDEQIAKAYEREIMQKGVQQGIQKEIQEIAYRMFKKNKPDDDILDTLAISPDELHKLKTEYYRA